MHQSTHSPLYFKFFIAVLAFLFCNSLQAQKTKGKLFIIGGGHRSDALMTQLVTLADLGKKDYVVVLPMSTEEPDSAYIFQKAIRKTDSKSNCYVKF